MPRTIPVDARLEAKLAAYRCATRARQVAADRVQALHRAGLTTEAAFRAYMEAERAEDRAAHGVAIAVEHRLDEQQRGAA